MLSDLTPADLAIWEEMINYHPLTAAPETQLTEVIAQINQAQSCDKHFINSACIFVVIDTQLVGFLPSLAILHWIATGVDLDQVAIAEVMFQPTYTMTKAALSEVGAATHLSHQLVDCPGNCIAIVDEQGGLLGVIDSYRLQSYLCQRLSESHTHIAQLQAENDEFRQSHGLSHNPNLPQSTVPHSPKVSDRKVLEAIPDLIIRMTQEGVYLDFLPAKNVKTIRPHSQMIGKTVFEVLPPELAHQRMHYVKQALETGNPQIYEYQVTIDGVLSDQEAQISCSGPDEVVLIIRDISDRKRREAQLVNAQVELIQAKTDLEVRVEEHTTALRNTHQQLQHEVAERQRIEQMLVENQTYLRVIHHISACLTSNPSVEQVIKVTLEQLSQYFRDLRVNYLVLNEDDTLSILQHIDPSESHPVVLTTSLLDAPNWVSSLRQLKPVVSNDVAQTPILEPKKETLLSEGIRALLDIPLKHSDTKIGVLSFESFHSRQWSEYEVSTLVQVAHYLSLVLREVNTQHLREWIEAALLQAQQTNTLLATALEKAGDAIEIINADYLIEYVNSAWEVMTGYSRAEAFGKTPGSLLRGGEHDQDFYQRIETAIAAGQTWRGKITAHHHNGTPFCQEVVISPVLNTTGKIEHYVAVKRDITERQRVEESLRLTQFSLDQATEIALWIRSDGKLLYVNKAACHALGCTQVDLLERSIDEIVCHFPTENWHTYWQTLKEQKSSSFESYHRTCQGDLLPVEMTISYLEFNGQEYGFAFARDLRHRKQAEAALRLRDQAITAINTGIVILDARSPDWPIVSINPAFERITGYMATEMIGASYQLLAQEKFREQPAIAQLRQALDQQRECTVVMQDIRKDGTSFWCEISIAPIYDSEGSVTHFVGIETDISDRQHAETQLKASLHEKELLLKEVHHRVKNNMQVICSIFSLRAQSVTDADTLSILTDSQNRIRSMALIHEKLYQSTSLAQIDFADYIRNLVQNLMSTYRNGVNKIQLNLNVSNVSLNIDTAIPCGLIINELVSNSLKHAFKSQQSGEITITLVNTTVNQLHLTVRDDGIGLPVDLDVQQIDSLGLRLIRALSRQLNGTWKIYTDRGTVFEIIF